MEECDAGPSWRLTTTSRRTALGRLTKERLRGIRQLDLGEAPACSEERLLGVVVAVADMGVDPTDHPAVQRFFEDLAIA